jgi:hypothetical protein
LPCEVNGTPRPISIFLLSYVESHDLAVLDFEFPEES